MRFSQGIRTVRSSHSSDIEAQLFKTLFTDVPTTLANERSAPSFELLPIGGVVVLPIEEKKNNENASAEHSIDR
jgi:hypothetical protein